MMRKKIIFLLIPYCRQLVEFYLSFSELRVSSIIFFSVIYFMEIPIHSAHSVLCSLRFLGPEQILDLPRSQCAKQGLHEGGIRAGLTIPYILLFLGITGKGRTHEYFHSARCRCLLPQGAGKVYESRGLFGNRRLSVRRNFSILPLNRFV